MGLLLLLLLLLCQRLRQPQAGCLAPAASWLRLAQQWELHNGGWLMRCCCAVMRVGRCGGWMVLLGRGRWQLGAGSTQTVLSLKASLMSVMNVHALFVSTYFGPDLLTWDLPSIWSRLPCDCIPNGFIYLL